MQEGHAYTHTRRYACACEYVTARRMRRHTYDINQRTPPFARTVRVRVARQPVGVVAFAAQRNRTYVRRKETSTCSFDDGLRTTVNERADRSETRRVFTWRRVIRTGFIGRARFFAWCNGPGGDKINAPFAKTTTVDGRQSVLGD